MGKRFFASLQFRLIVTFAVVLAVTLGSVSAYVRYATAHEVEQYQERLEAARADRVQGIVTSFYAPSLAWTDVQPVIEQAGMLYGMQIYIVNRQGEVVGDSRRFMRDPGQPVWRPGPLRPSHDDGGSWFDGRRPPYSAWTVTAGQNLSFTIASLPTDYPAVLVSADSQPIEQVRTLPIVNDGMQVGSVVVRPNVQAAALFGPEPQASEIVASVDRFLLWTGVAAATAGMALIVLLSRRTLQPLNALRVAAQHLGRGDFAQRVPTIGTTEVQALGHTFNSMAADLQKAEEQRRGMMADIAHELRTPLSNIQGYLEALRDGMLLPNAATLDVIHGQVLQLSHLLEDLRLLALADAGALRLDRQQAPVHEFLRSSIEAFRPRAEAQGIALSLIAGDDLPAVSIDRARIAQVVGNLLDNALIHTPTGGSVTVRAEMAHGQVAVRVDDTGEGMGGGVLERVFDRFYRVDPSRSRQTGGSGLGLSIARQLVEAHGGTIRAESTPGSGSSFVFTLPAANPNENDG